MSSFAHQLRENYLRTQKGEQMNEYNNILRTIEGKESMILRKELDPVIVSLLKFNNFEVTIINQNFYDGDCNGLSHKDYTETIIINLPYKYEQLKKKLIEVSKFHDSYVINGVLNSMIIKWLEKDGIIVKEEYHEGSSCSCEYECRPGCAGDKTAYFETIMKW